MSTPYNLLIQRALISVSDKTGILEFAKFLQDQGVHILSTGGTAHFLKTEGIRVEEVPEYTGFPEIMGGRVKTLHPKIHGGLLGRRNIDKEVMDQQGIEAIDLLVVNLYPFAETIRTLNHDNVEDLHKAIEQIDIGGPAMLRSAAKNYQHVTVLIDPSDYEMVQQEIQDQKYTTLKTRFKLAQKTFTHIAQYDADIANHLNRLNFDVTNNTLSAEAFPESFTVQFHKKQNLRYGENPHQKAAFYVEKNPAPGSIALSNQHQGKALSFNNLVDANAALECVKLFGNKQACVIVKHANPCGVALSETQAEAYKRAFTTDPTSAFGGIIAFNQPLSTETTKTILENQFLEVLIAPSIDSEALQLLSQKPNIRVLSTGYFDENTQELDYNRILGGLLIQERDNMVLCPKELSIVTKRAPTVQEFNDLLFAWEVAKCVKSNAIVYAKDNSTIGIGAGQMSRIFSTLIAGLKAKDAGLKVKGSVMASDAFFPFRDNIDAAKEAGITAIIQPGGSIRDEEVIKAADEANIAMVFTHVRHFKH